MIDQAKFKASIPAELAGLSQWVVADERKVPYRPYDPATEASHSSPDNWGTLDDATANARPYVGFVFSESDDYIGIDLDKTETGQLPAEVVDFHRMVLESFADCYIERSISGTGYHIICKGKLNTDLSGTKNSLNRMEIYQHSRYFTVSGDVVNMPATLPNKSAWTVDLFDRLSNGRARSVVMAEIAATESDGDIIAKMQRAVNWERSIAPLWSVAVKPDDEMKSENDHALMSHIYFYTKCRSQAVRLFKMSARGEALARKPKPDYYIEFTFNSIMSNDQAVQHAQLPDPAAAFYASQANAPATEVEEASPTAFVFDATTVPPAQYPRVEVPTVSEPGTTTQGTFPPGKMGDIARYIYEQAPRPSVEFSTACAIAAIAGLAGRAYTFNKSTLNVFICMVGLSASGKSSQVAGISRLYGSVGDDMLRKEAFNHLGANRIASASGLAAVLAENPCQIATLGEFGIQLSKMCSPKASAVDAEIKGMLLDLYSAERIQASNNKAKDNRTAAVNAPSFSFLGDATPSTLYSGIQVSDIESGLINRITVVDLAYVPSKNKHHTAVSVPANIKSSIAELVQVSIKRNEADNYPSIPVGIKDDARALLAAYDDECEAVILDMTMNDIHRNMYARKHEKAARLAALLAVSDNRHLPEVTAAHVQYAIDYTNQDVECVLRKYHDGSIGDSDTKRVTLLRTMLATFATIPFDSKLRKFRMKRDQYEAYVFGSRDLLPLTRLADFKSTPGLSGTKALNAILADELDRGVIEKIIDNSQFGAGPAAKLYKVVDMSAITESLKTPGGA